MSWMQERESHHGDLRTEMQLGFARQDARMVELRETIRADIAELRQQMEARGADRERRWGSTGRTSRTTMADLRQEMADLRHEIAQRASDLIKWSFLFWVGAVGAIAALAGVLR